MGQRSQIYVAFNNALRDDNGKVIPDTKAEWKLVARYYGWNFGSRMVSRAWGLIDWLQTQIRYLNFTQLDKIVRVSDVNFDFRDVVISSDLIEEAEDFEDYYDSSNEYIFDFNNCNDGKLFICVEDNGTISYCFTDNEDFEPLSARQYMAWGNYSSEEPHSNLEENIQNISDSAKLMTFEELVEFRNRAYCNVKECIEAKEG